MKKGEHKITGSSYIPTLLRNPPKRGSMKRSKIVYYIGGKLRKGKEAGTMYAGPFLNEVTALEMIGEKGWRIYKVSKNTKFIKRWYWKKNKWIRYDK